MNAGLEAPPEQRGAAASGRDGVASWYVVAILMLAYTVAFIDRQVITLLIQPIKRDLGVNDTQVSLLTGFAFAIFYTVLGLPIARLADKTNRKRLIAVGVLVWSLMTAACGLASSYWLLFAARVGVGVGEATISPAAMSMIADYFSPRRLARAISVYTVGLYLGAGVAVLAGSVVVRLSSGTETFMLPLLGAVRPWQVTFFLVGLLGFPLLLLLMTIKEPKRQELDRGGRVAAGPVRDASIADVMAFAARNRRLLAAHFAGYGLLGTVISAYMAWAPELLRRSYGLDIADAGLIFGSVLVVFGVAGPISASFLTSWLRSRGREDAEMRASVIAGVGMVPLVIAMPLAPSLEWAVGLLGLTIFFLSAPQGLAPAVIQIIAPNRMRGQLTALFMLVAVLASYTIGPSSVALLTDYVFRDEAALRYALATVCGVLTPLGVCCLALGLKPYRQAQRRSRDAD